MEVMLEFSNAASNRFERQAGRSALDARFPKQNPPILKKQI